MEKRMKKEKKIAKDFLKKVMDKLKYQIEYFFDKTKGDLPTIYRERQFHSVLFPAIYFVSKVVMFEQPVKRIKNTRNNKQGWMDYWCYLTVKKADLLIEVKHALHTLKSEKPTKWIQAQWEEVLGQIKDFSVKSIKEDIAVSKKAPIKIALLFIQTYAESKSNSKRSLPNGKLKDELIKKHFKAISSKLDPKPNFCAVWSFPFKLQKIFEDKTGKDKYYSLELFAYWRL